MTGVLRALAGHPIDPDNPAVPVRLYAADGTTPLLGVPAALADDTANPSLSAIQAYLMNYDPTSAGNWDRLRQATGDALSKDGLTAAAALGFNGSTWDRIRVGTKALWDGLANTTAGILGNAPLLSNTANTDWRPFNSAKSFTDAEGGANTPTAALIGFNGTNFDRVRNNHDVTVGASAARTSTFTSSDLTTYNGKRLYIVVDVTAFTSGGLTPAIKAKDSLSGKYFALTAAITKIAATGTYVYELGTGAATAAAGGITQVAQVVIPRTLQVLCTPDDATSITYSVAMLLSV